MKWRVWKVNHERWMYPLELVNPLLDAAVRKVAACDEGGCTLEDDEYEQLSKMLSQPEFHPIR